MVTTGHIPKGFTGYCYRLLNTPSDVNLFKQNGKRNLTVSCNKPLGNSGTTLALNFHAILISGKMSLKMYSRWYLTPDTISKMYGGNGRLLAFVNNPERVTDTYGGDCGRIKNLWKTVALIFFYYNKEAGQIPTPDIFIKYGHRRKESKYRA